MNINEVEKHVKSEFTITLILYILTGLTMIISIFAILTVPVSASEIKSLDITNGVANTTNCGSKSNGSYCYGQFATSSISWTKTSFNSSNGYAVSDLAFDLNGTLPQYSNVPSTLQIKSPANSFKNSSYSCSWGGNNQPSSCSVVRVSSSQLNVNFKMPVGGASPQYLYITIGDYSDPTTYLSNININKIVILQTIDDPNAGVIENANQNTASIINNQNENNQDLINNQNENTQDIINNQNQNTQSTNTNNNSWFFKLLSQLSNLCSNVIDSTATPYLIEKAGNVTQDQNFLSFSTIQTYSRVVFRVPVKKNTTYYFRSDYSTTSNGVNSLVRIDGFNFPSFLAQTSNFFNSNGLVSFSFNSGNNSYVYVSLYGTVTNYQLAVVTWKNLYLGTSNSFCTFGEEIGGNKLDGIEGAVRGGLSDVNDSIQDTNDFLTDDTDPSVNTSEINNVIGQVQIQDPLNYLLTLPINLLTKLNTLISSGTCQRASFGELYGTELYLPCINFENYLGSSLWTTIDTIVGIGLLVIILKKFYDSISNILSLGKEEEIRKGMELPTPMEFLSQILGGGK